MLYNIKCLLVIIHSRCYSLSLIVTDGIISAYYALVLGNRPFPNLLFHQILLFRLHLRKCVNNLVIHPQKVRLQNLKLIFPVILRIFDIESHSQTSVKVASVMFALVFMKFRKLRSLYQKTKSSFSIKLRYFHCLNHSLFYPPLQLDKSCFQKTDLCKLLKIV